MDDLIAALQILRKYLGNTNARSPTNTSHDTLWIMDVTPENVSDDDLVRLYDLGFVTDEGAFISHRFGSA